MSLPRVGLALTEKRHVPMVLAAVARAEERGVPMVWSDVNRGVPDPMTFFTTVAERTGQIGLGTAIVPTYPRHPAVLAAQAQALHQLAPGRFRLGVGSSHRHIVADAFGHPFGKPLDHLREYVGVLRGLLWDGRADYEGAYYAVHLRMEDRADIPIYVSALREQAFRLAGEIADGGISWLCPPEYLRQSASVALRAGAAAAGRATPRLVANVPVVVTADRAKMLAVARPQVAFSVRLPFYGRMFTAAGFPTAADGVVDDNLLDNLVVWGDEAAIAARLEALLGHGIDELIVKLLPAAEPALEEQRLSDILASLAHA